MKHLFFAALMLMSTGSAFAQDDNGVVANTKDIVGVQSIEGHIIAVEPRFTAAPQVCRFNSNGACAPMPSRPYTSIKVGFTLGCTNNLAFAHYDTQRLEDGRYQIALAGVEAVSSRAATSLCNRATVAVIYINVMGEHLSLDEVVLKNLTSVTGKKI